MPGNMTQRPEVFVPIIKKILFSYFVTKFREKTCLYERNFKAI